MFVLLAVAWDSVVPSIKISAADADVAHSIEHIAVADEDLSAHLVDAGSHGGPRAGLGSGRHRNVPGTACGQD